MGKKKSVVFMTLLTIVIVALCALVAFPAFPIPGKPDSWNPVALQYDLDADLGGGYYVYYYPEGVIPEAEYDEQLTALQAAYDEAEAKDKDKALEELNEFKADYVPYKKDGKATSLYLSTDSELAIVDSGEPTDEFKTNFEEVASAVATRFAQKEYSTLRYAIVDDFSIRVELPYSEFNASGIFSALALSGDMTIAIGDEIVDELKAEGTKVTDLIKSVSIGTRYKTSFLKVKFTAAGEDMLERVKDTLSNMPTTSTSASGTTLDIKIGDNVIAQIYKDSIMPNNREARVFAVEQINKAYLETFEILLNNVLEEGGYEISFRELTTSDVRTFEPVYGENVLTLLYIALAIVIVALLVLPIVFLGRFGVVGAYSSLSYFIITAICFAFISGGIFEVSLGTVLIFLVGLALVNVLHYHVYGAIKKEFELGKTVESCVKFGYKKTLWNIVDIYAVLGLGALAALIGVAGLYTFALQALICIVSAAFCSLLWSRAINFVLLSASKDKYKYFRFVREEDDDDE